MACSFSYFLCLSLQWSETEAWMKGKEMKKKHAFFSHLTTHLSCNPKSCSWFRSLVFNCNESDEWREEREARIKHKANGTQEHTRNQEWLNFPFVFLVAVVVVLLSKKITLFISFHLYFNERSQHNRNKDLVFKVSWDWWCTKGKVKVNRSLFPSSFSFLLCFLIKENKTSETRACFI